MDGQVSDIQQRVLLIELSFSQRLPKRGFVGKECRLLDTFRVIVKELVGYMLTRDVIEWLFVSVAIMARNLRALIRSNSAMHRG